MNLLSHSSESKGIQARLAPGLQTTSSEFFLYIYTLFYFPMASLTKHGTLFDLKQNKFYTRVWIYFMLFKND